MKIGIPSEIKDHEYRVGMTPAGVHTLVERGHEVVVERGAGVGSGFEDEDYVAAGATILPEADEVWAGSEMIVKVKEPVGPEHDRLQEGQLLFTYLHLAPLPELTQVLQDKRVAGVAYETITDRRGALPLL
ncbi:MAG TPA: alanine dehydrogenase, partial [Thermoanaerobaculia bacterium]